MISVLKSTLNLNNLKILRPKVTKNLTNLLKMFCETSPWSFDFGVVTGEVVMDFVTKVLRSVMRGEEMSRIIQNWVTKLRNNETY